MNAVPTQAELADAMLEFVRPIPASANLEWVKERNFLYFFEAERLLKMREALLAAGFNADVQFRVLDFGYLHGLVPEFLHRFFPRTTFTVLDHPDSPNFTDCEYQRLIAARTYLTLRPCDIASVRDFPGTYDLIILGEIIEHLDPTTVAKAAADLRAKVNSSGCLLITTPNGGGIFNTVYTFLGKDAQVPPIPNPVHHYGHIHIWTMTLLRKTLEHFGWRELGEWFTHGKEGQCFRDLNAAWGSLRHQVLMRLLWLAADLRPKWRGFTVSTWRPAEKTAVASVS